MYKFFVRFGVETSIDTKKITTIPHHFISTVLNAYFDFNVSFANDVAIDVLSGHFRVRWCRGLPCPEVHTLTNEFENGCKDMMK